MELVEGRWWRGGSFHDVSYIGLMGFKCINQLYIYILSFYIPFSDRVGLPLHNTPFPGVLMKSIGAAFFDRMPFLTSTTCVGCNMCYVFNVNVTDSFDDRRSQCRFDLMIMLPPQTLIPRISN